MKNDVAQDWESVYAQTGFGGGYPDIHLVRFVARTFYGKPNRSKVKLLELGCGVGANLWYLSQEGFDSHGIDISPSAIEKCGEHLASKNLKAKLFVGNAESTEFKAGTFDGVIDVECIYANRLAAIRKIFAEACRLLKRDGRFFGLLFSRGSWGDKTGDLIEANTYANVPNRIFGHRGIAHFFSQEEIESLLQEAGFRYFEINLTYRTEDHQQNVIKEWIVQATK